MKVRFFYSKIQEVIIAAVGCVLVAVALFTDVFVLADEVKENSVTEIMQELILLAVSLLFIKRAAQDNARRPALVLMAGFFSCFLSGSWILPLICRHTAAGSG